MYFKVFLENTDRSEVVSVYKTFCILGLRSPCADGMAVALTGLFVSLVFTQQAAPQAVRKGRILCAAAAAAISREAVSLAFV